jgi:pimeloyl-ACP methyl ester carboxylesterase
MGKSDRTPYLPARTWQDDLLGLLDELRIDQAHVAGTSLGARVATRIALDAPDRVTTLVVDAPILRNEPAGDAALTHLLGPDMPAHFATSVADWQGEGWREVVETYRSARSDAGFQAHYSTAAEVSRLRMPVFITRGDTDDAMHPISHATQLHAACATSALWIAPRTGFSAMRFRATHFAELLGEFISSESIK